MVKWLAFLIFFLPGLAIMMITIYKYFLLLSGIRSIYIPAPAVQLKKDGIHKYVRHPLYLGTLLFIWGLFFIFPMLNNLIAVIIITLYVFGGIMFEEKKLLQQFGSSYVDYISTVPMIFPIIFKKKS